MGDGDEALLFFRGRFEGELDLSDYFDVDVDGDKVIADLSSLDGMGEDELWELVVELGGCGYKEDSTVDDLKEVIIRRVEREIEPAVQVKHYIARNKGKQGRDIFINCANPEAASEAKDWKFETDCRCCHERMNGDRGVSTMQPFTWTVYDMRDVHRVAATGKGKDAKDTYEPCTMKTKNRCRWCSMNNGIDSRDQDDITLDELKELVKQGYSRRYRNGLRLLELPESQYSLIEALEMEVRNTHCRSCSNASLEVTGATCPECEDDFDFDALMSTGWDPDKPYAMVVRCENCSAQVKPVSSFECSECNNPVSARLGDVPVLARMTKEGKNDRRVWTFKVVGNAEPFELGQDDERDRIIGAKLFDFDEVGKAPTIEHQVKTLGAAVDPITGEAVGASTSQAPTVGRSTRQAKGGKPGGLKSGGIKRTQIKTTNRSLGSRFTKRA